MSENDDLELQLTQSMVASASGGRRRYLVATKTFKAMLAGVLLAAVGINIHPR
jgi:hypothetical protein